MAHCSSVLVIKCACTGYLADVNVKIGKRAFSSTSQDLMGHLQTIILRCCYNASCGVNFIHLFSSSDPHSRDADKLDVVKAILVNLSRDMERWNELNTDIFESSTLPIDHYFRKSPISEPVGLGRSCGSDPISLRHGRSQTLTVEGTHHYSWAQKIPTSEFRMSSKDPR